jgi:hypothetical protein
MSSILAMRLSSERRIVDLFRTAGATDPESAVDIDPRAPSWKADWRHLREQHVIRANHDRFYLDESAWRRLNRSRTT